MNNLEHLSDYALDDRIQIRTCKQRLFFDFWEFYHHVYTQDVEQKIVIGWKKVRIVWTHLRVHMGHDYSGIIFRFSTRESTDSQVLSSNLRKNSLHRDVLQRGPWMVS